MSVDTHVISGSYVRSNARKRAYDECSSSTTNTAVRWRAPVQQQHAVITNSVTTASHRSGGKENKAAGSNAGTQYTQQPSKQPKRSQSSNNINNNAATADTGKQQTIVTLLQQQQQQQVIELVGDDELAALELPAGTASNNSSSSDKIPTVPELLLGADVVSQLDRIFPPIAPVPCDARDASDEQLADVFQWRAMMDMDIKLRCCNITNMAERQAIADDAINTVADVVQLCDTILAERRAAAVAMKAEIERKRAEAKAKLERKKQQDEKQRRIAAAAQQARRDAEAQQQTQLRTLQQQQQLALQQQRALFAPQQPGLPVSARPIHVMPASPAHHAAVAATELQQSPPVSGCTQPSPHRPTPSPTRHVMPMARVSPVLTIAEEEERDRRKREQYQQRQQRKAVPPPEFQLMPITADNTQQTTATSQQQAVLPYSTHQSVHHVSGVQQSNCTIANSNTISPHVSEWPRASAYIVAPKPRVSANPQLAVAPSSTRVDTLAAQRFVPQQHARVLEHVDLTVDDEDDGVDNEKLLAVVEAAERRQYGQQRYITPTPQHEHAYNIPPRR